jgi:hypothetical protein
LVHCLEDFESEFMSATMRSYGVREEMHGSGEAIKEVLLEAPEKVNCIAIVDVIVTIDLFFFVHTDAGVP